MASHARRYRSAWRGPDLQRRFVAIERRFVAIERRFLAVERRLELQRRVVALEQRVVALEQRVVVPELERQLVEQAELLLPLVGEPLTAIERRWRWWR